ncbi:MAG: beta-lactamase family protein [Hyphomonas sp.]|uniref:serine hydrolase domain-containing protein n=1 Tax=Hyphomonas sp. TaxID=87 RepID=UPI0017CBB44B|nr:serine hydrolase domain-containing protein [Hyphomonas sp.]MBA3069950.1 beta-lactamase family protein [Hyphomonas sp.]MBU3921673.1 beta-lactamase family protein [Alphaproteobacteria bacterium]MBU4060474.1 beta-lactamase family protein [Alphaproteobacteria bacterium]MBU4163142.1 beta-lactamase family protein [Alphaproteobacteria bacterium]
MSKVEVHGFVHDKYAPVRAAFESNFATGQENGAAFCMTVGGEMVADIWAGSADEAGTRPWEQDTIVNVYSTTKTMTALTALLLADRGELDFAAPVARYWPEFAANGKADVTVAQLMSHSAGLSGWKEPLVREDLYDWEKATSLLAAQAPYWTPGTAPGYHAMTQGFLVGEVVRRVTGMSLGTVFRKELAEPLGADFHIGLPATEDHRVADLTPPPPGSGIGQGQSDPLVTNMASNPPINPLDTRTRAWRGAEIPAAGGTGNARSVAAVQTVMANGGFANGKQILSEAGCRKALELQIEGNDLILGIPVRYGMGFGLAGGAVPFPNPNTIYWGGYGGSLVVIDMDARATYAYAMNKMAATTTGDMRAFTILMAAWGAMAG